MHVISNWFMVYQTKKQETGLEIYISAKEWRSALTAVLLYVVKVFISNLRVVTILLILLVVVCWVVVSLCVMWYCLNKMKWTFKCLILRAWLVSPLPPANATFAVDSGWQRFETIIQTATNRFKPLQTS